MDILVKILIGINTTLVTTGIIAGITFSMNMSKEVALQGASIERILEDDTKILSLEKQVEINRKQIKNDNTYNWRRDSMQKQWINEILYENGKPSKNWDFNDLELE